MCGPMIIGLISAAVSGLGGLMKMQQANAVAEANAREFERQAKIERMVSSFEGKRFVGRYQRTLGQQIAALGSRGIDPSFAVPFIESDAEEADLDLGAIRTKGRIASDNQLARADAARFGKTGGFAMALAFIAPVIKAAGTATVGGNPFATAGATGPPMNLL